MAVTWAKGDTDSRGEGASSARIAWSERWAGPGGDVMAPGLRSCKEGSVIGHYMEAGGNCRNVINKRNIKLNILLVLFFLSYGNLKIK